MSGAEELETHRRKASDSFLFKFFRRYTLVRCFIWSIDNKLFQCFEILCQVECSVCQRSIFPGDEVECSVRDCTGVFHLECAKERLGLSSPKMFKCPQHVSWIWYTSRFLTEWSQNRFLT